MPRQYIHTQRILRGVGSELWRHDYPDPDSDSWQNVAECDREEFLASEKRLCVAAPSGFGKTTTAEWIVNLRHQRDRTSLCLQIPANKLPADVDRLLGDEGDTKECALVQSLCNTEQTNDCDRRQARRAITRTIKLGKFTLVVDGFDQISGDEDCRREKLAALAEFLRRYPKCSCVVTGRDYDVTVDLPELEEESEPWQLAYLLPFTEEESARFVGPDVFARLKHLDVTLLSNPRALNAIMDHSSRRPEELQSQADVYWAASRHVLEKSLVSRSSLTLDRIVYLLALLAFETDRQRFRATVEPEDFERFLRCALRFHGEGDELKRDIKEFAKLNVAIGHAIIANRDMDRLVWENATIQEFYSAVWLTRFARREDRSAVRQALRSRRQWERWAAIFCMASEMPQHDPLVCRSRKYLHAMSIAYGGNGEYSRLSEVVYRSWPRMLELYYYGPKRKRSRRLTDEQRDQLTARLQSEVRAAFERGDSPIRPPAAKRRFKPRQAARYILTEFLSAFLRGTEHSPALAELDKDGFHTVFEASPDRNSPEYLDMAKTPLTNEVYRHFDPQHFSRFDEYHDFSPADKCPVVNVTWYDAWCAAIWFHAQLPTEQQWDLACMGRPDAAVDEHTYGFGMDSASLPNYGWYRESGRRHAHEVATRQPCNGLYDMHGNVWEWTGSWSLEILVHAQPRGTRVRKGGSYRSSAAQCATGSRRHNSPSTSCSAGGFRLCRGPKCAEPHTEKIAES